MGAHTPGPGRAREAGRITYWPVACCARCERREHLGVPAGGLREAIRLGWGRKDGDSSRALLCPACAGAGTPGARGTDGMGTGDLGTLGEVADELARTRREHPGGPRPWPDALGDILEECRGIGAEIPGPAGRPAPSRAGLLRLAAICVRAAADLPPPAGGGENGEGATPTGEGEAGIGPGPGRGAGG